MNKYYLGGECDSCLNSGICQMKLRRYGGTQMSIIADNADCHVKEFERNRFIVEIRNCKYYPLPQKIRDFFRRAVP